MLTGKPPFSGATVTALSLQIVQAPAPAPSSINKSLPKEFDGIVLKALAKSLNRRYESAAVMAAELRALAAVLDVRSGTSEPADLAAGLPRAASSSSARGARAGHLRPRRRWSPVAVVLLLGAIAAGGIWLERDPIRKLWRRTLGPPPSPVIAVIPLELAGADRAQVAEQVASALRVTLQPTASSARAAARAVDPRAYDLYIRGRQATAQRRPGDAVRFYEQALAADAGLAEALAGIVEALEFATITAGQPIDAPTLQRMKTTAARAYQLDPDLPQANLAMALAASPLAETLGYLRHALELDPTYGEALHQIGDQILDFDPARAIDFYRASLAADPSLEAGHTDIAGALIALNRWDEAHREADAV